MIDNNQLLLEKIDNLKKENSELKENRDGLIQQYHKHKEKIADLKVQLHAEENFRLIVCAALPIEMINELVKRQKLFKLSSDKESEKADE